MDGLTTVFIVLVGWFALSVCTDTLMKKSKRLDI